jgi:hypothetical protein
MVGAGSGRKTAGQKSQNESRDGGAGVRAVQSAPAERAKPKSSDGRNQQIVKRQKKK